MIMIADQKIVNKGTGIIRSQKKDFALNRPKKIKTKESVKTKKTPIIPLVLNVLAWFLLKKIPFFWGDASVFLSIFLSTELFEDSFFFSSCSLWRNSKLMFPFRSARFSFGELFSISFSIPSIST